MSQIIAIADRLIAGGYIVYGVLAAIHLVFLATATLKLRRFVAVVLGWVVAGALVMLVSLLTGRPVNDLQIDFLQIGSFSREQTILLVMVPAGVGMLVGYLTVGLFQYGRRFESIRMVTTFIYAALTLAAGLLFGSLNWPLQSAVMVLCVSFLLGVLFYWMLSLATRDKSARSTVKPAEPKTVAESKPDEPEPAQEPEKKIRKPSLEPPTDEDFPDDAW